MGALLRLLFAALFIIALFFVAASALGSIAFNPESKAWRELLAKLRARIRPKTEGLAVLDAETLSHFSLKPKIFKKATWRDSVTEGSFGTIYQEQMLVFAGQKLGKTAAWALQGAQHEYVFRKKAKETEIWRDGLPYAVFLGNNLLEAGKNGRLLAQLGHDPELRQWPVLMGSSEAATMTNEERAVSPIPRAFTLLRPLTPEEAETLVLLCVLNSLEKI
jgi:hypothetical protein